MQLLPILTQVFFSTSQSLSKSPKKKITSQIASFMLKYLKYLNT
jgi:hypothetical protein